MHFEQVYSDEDLELQFSDNFPKFIDGVDDLEGKIAPFLTTSKALVFKSLKQAVDLLPRGKQEKWFLELGSGDGRFCVAALLPPFSFSKAVGIEIEEDLVQKARFRASRCDGLKSPPIFIHASICDLNFAELALRHFGLPTKTYDSLVVALYMLGDTSQNVVRNLVRSLYNGGAVLVSIVFPLDEFNLQFSGEGVYVYRCESATASS